MSFRIIGRGLEQAVVACHRFVESPELLERCAAIAESVNVVPVSFQCLIDLPYSFGEVSALQKDHAEQVAAVEMIGPGAKDLMVDFFGVFQFAALVQRQALREQ